MSHAGGLSILVVDDSRDIADLLVEVFSSRGHEASAVYSGADAVSAVDRLAPDIVFLDISMPDMNGFEVAARVRSLWIGLRSWWRSHLSRVQHLCKRSTLPVSTCMWRNPPTCIGSWQRWKLRPGRTAGAAGGKA